MRTPLSMLHDALPGGTIVGSYVLGRFIGQGGMATVYEATNRDIGKRVALKILHRDLAQQPEMAQRFLNEARWASQVAHPGLISIFDCGRTETGIYYLAMELLEGVSLERYVEQRTTLAVPEAIVFGRQLASALAAVHQHGVVHRDLKPSNIFIVEDVDSADGKRTKILDFGIAKFSRATDRGGCVTKMGVVLGTPRYMSPEQWRELPTITDKADVYALGIVCFEMLVGETPFSGSDYQLMNDHVYRKPPAPGDIAPWVPAELSGLIGTMLKKLPEDRPSMLQVAQQLRGLGLDAAGGPLPREERRRDPVPGPRDGASRLLPGAAPPADRSPSNLRPAAQLDGPSARLSRVLPAEPMAAGSGAPERLRPPVSGTRVSRNVATGGSEVELVRSVLPLATPEAVLLFDAQVKSWQASSQPSFLSYLTQAGVLTHELGRTLSAVHKGYLHVDKKMLASLVHAAGRAPRSPPTPVPGTDRGAGKLESGPISLSAASPGNRAAAPEASSPALPAPPKAAPAEPVVGVPKSLVAAPESVVAAPEPVAPEPRVAAAEPRPAELAPSAVAPEPSVVAPEPRVMIPEPVAAVELPPPVPAALVPPSAESLRPGRPATLGPVVRAASPAAPSLALHVGDWVDRYQVLAGLVCDAASVRFDSFSEPLGQLVAVVIAPPPPAGQGGTPGAALLAPDRAQYNQDALALARKLKDLSHPGLAAVVDSGVTGVRPFLVYERGGELTLENLVGYLGAMPMRQVLALGLEIVDALGEAARVGLAHRALLPDCIRYRGSGTICITGVGACELLHAAAPVVAVAPRPALALSAPRSAAARSGRSAASPASGVAHPDDPRLADDLQGMGGLLFLAATGSTLPLRGTDTERARAQVKLGLAQRGVPAVLSALIQRLLSPSPEARYPSWELLGGELADLVAGLGESQPWPPHSSNANPGV